MDQAFFSFKTEKNIELLSLQCESKLINADLVNKFETKFKPLIKKICKQHNITLISRKNIIYMMIENQI